MTEPVQTLEQSTLTDDFVDETELSTAHLTATILDGQRPGTGAAQIAGDWRASTELDTDWVALLASRPLATAILDDEPPEPMPMPSGMAAHSAPPRMAPTIWSRLTTGVRRATLLALLLTLAAGVLAGGAFVIYSTSWLSALQSPAQSAPTTGQTSSAAIPPQAGAQTASGQAQPDAPAQAQPLDTSTGSANDTAGQLRDQGIAQYKAGHYDQAISLLETSVSMNGDAVSYYQLGLAYMAATGREHALEDAELAFRTAASLQPDWAAPYRLLAESLLRRGFSNDAIATAKEATRLDPTQTDAWLTLARAYDGAGQKAEASSALAQAARLAPAPPGGR